MAVINQVDAQLWPPAGSPEDSSKTSTIIKQSGEGLVHITSEDLKLVYQTVEQLDKIDDEQLKRDIEQAPEKYDESADVFEGVTDEQLRQLVEELEKVDGDAQDSGSDTTTRALFSIAMAPVLNADQQKALDVQNAGRRGKAIPALAWDESLARAAQQWANHLAKDVGKLQHSTSAQRPDQGENLFFGWKSPGPFRDPLQAGAKAWMDEAKKYHGERIGEGQLSDFGHFTQCMWKSTKKVGMAVATDSSGAVYVVGRYSPPGNFVGQKPF